MDPHRWGRRRAGGGGADVLEKEKAEPTISVTAAGSAPSKDDALHSTDGYAELAALPDDSRDDAIFAASQSNLKFKKTVMEEEDEDELQKLLEADLERFRRGEPPQL